MTSFCASQGSSGKAEGGAPDLLTQSSRNRVGERPVLKTSSELLDS